MSGNYLCVPYKASHMLPCRNHSIDAATELLAKVTRRVSNASLEILTENITGSVQQREVMVVWLRRQSR